MPKPIISRHGSKGGRFIDGMYTQKLAKSYITGITIIEDMGIFSDHNMVISKCDLGMQEFKISDEKQEKIDFRKILNIPMTITTGSNHPTLSQSTFKGLAYTEHAKLFYSLQEIIYDKESGIIKKM